MTKSIFNFGIKLLIFLILFSSSLTSCSDKEAITQEKSLNSVITGINIFGNAVLDISSENMDSVGFELGDLMRLEGGENIGTLTLPYVDDYIYVGTWGMCLNKFPGESFITLALTNGSFTGRVGGKVGDKIVLSIDTKNGFSDKYQKLIPSISYSRDEYASDEEFANFRMVECGNIANGKLYRSSKPTMNLKNKNRYLYADNLARKVGINTIISLSDNPETWAQLVASNQDIGSYSLEIFNKGNLDLCELGVDMYQSNNLKKINSIIHYMATHDAPFLISCDLGRDRTGILCILFEILAGASYEEIEKDYMKSFENVYHMSSSDDSYSKLKESFLNRILYIIYQIGEVDIVKLNLMQTIDVSTFFPQLKSKVKTYFYEKVGVTETELNTVMSKIQNT